MGIWIDDSGASQAEIRKGVDAAMAWFQKTGLDPEIEWNQYQADNDTSSNLWSMAEGIAFRAAFEGWEEWPEHASMIFE